MAHSITFSPDAWADYLYWQSEDKKTLKRINKLLQELQRDGAVQGIGKAELLLPDRLDGGTWRAVSFEYNDEGWYMPGHPDVSPVGLWARERQD